MSKQKKEHFVWSKEPIFIGFIAILCSNILVAESLMVINIANQTIECRLEICIHTSLFYTI